MTQTFYTSRSHFENDQCSSPSKGQKLFLKKKSSFDFCQQFKNNQYTQILSFSSDRYSERKKRMDSGEKILYSNRFHRFSENKLSSKEKVNQQIIYPEFVDFCEKEAIMISSEPLLIKTQDFQYSYFQIPLLSKKTPLIAKFQPNNHNIEPIIFISTKSERPSSVTTEKFIKGQYFVYYGENRSQITFTEKTLYVALYTNIAALIKIEVVFGKQLASHLLSKNGNNNDREDKYEQLKASFKQSELSKMTKNCLQNLVVQKHLQALSHIPNDELRKQIEEIKKKRNKLNTIVKNMYQLKEWKPEVKKEKFKTFVLKQQLKRDQVQTKFKELSEFTLQRKQQNLEEKDAREVEKLKHKKFLKRQKIAKKVIVLLELMNITKFLHFQLRKYFQNKVNHFLIFTRQKQTIKCHQKILLQKGENPKQRSIFDTQVMLSCYAQLSQPNYIHNSETMAISFIKESCQLFYLQEQFIKTMQQIKFIQKKFRQKIQTEAFFKQKLQNKWNDYFFEAFILFKIKNIDDTIDLEEMLKKEDTPQNKLVSNAYIRSAKSSGPYIEQLFQEQKLQWIDQFNAYREKLQLNESYKQFLKPPILYLIPKKSKFLVKLEDFIHQKLFYNKRFDKNMPKQQSQLY